MYTLNTKWPHAGPCSSLPSSSKIAGITPKNGRQAEPGLRGVAPGNGEIKGAPFFVNEKKLLI